MFNHKSFRHYRDTLCFRVCSVPCILPSIAWIEDLAELCILELLLVPIYISLFHRQDKRVIRRIDERAFRRIDERAYRRIEQRAFHRLDERAFHRQDERAFHRQDERAFHRQDELG